MVTVNNPTHFESFYAKFKIFRLADKYVDVTIRCENQNFKCHRIILAAASDYFDVMFSSAFRERDAETVDLSDSIEASTLEEILQYVYSGDVTINSDNLLALLKASEFFHLSGLEELCTAHLETKEISTQSRLDVYAFACETNKQKLIDLLSEQIAKQLRIFCSDNTFLETPFQRLAPILEKASTLSPSANNNPEILFSQSVRWVLHDRENRLRYLNELFANLTHQFANVSSQTIQFAICNLMQLVSAADAKALSVQLFTSVSQRGKISSGEACGFTGQSLNIYVKSNEANLMRVFSINGAGDQCSIVGEILDWRRTNADPRRWIRSVVVDNHYVYSLHYNRRSPAKDASALQEQSFNVCTAANMNATVNLRTPPVVFEDVKFCATRNNRVYVYNQTMCNRRSTADSDQRIWVNLSDEEIENGIYLYHCDLDCWFPVPAMKKKVADACPVVHDGILYMIGGVRSDEEGYLVTRSVQAFDCRAGVWRYLPQCTMPYVGGDSFATGGEIYVSGGAYNGRMMDKYDLAAGVWTNWMRTDTEMQFHRMLPHSNKFWAMGSFDEDNPARGDLSISVINPTTRVKRTSSILADAAERFLGRREGIVMDAVLFE